MDTARIDHVPAPLCDEELLACIAHRIGPCAATAAARWRVALLGPSGEPYRVIQLDGFGEYAELAQILRTLGYCHALPCAGYDECYRQLWPSRAARPPLQGSPQRPASAQAS